MLHKNKAWLYHSTAVSSCCDSLRSCMLRRVCNSWRAQLRWEATDLYPAASRVHCGLEVVPLPVVATKLVHLGDGMSKSAVFASRARTVGCKVAAQTRFVPGNAEIQLSHKNHTCRLHIVFKQ